MRKKPPVSMLRSPDRPPLPRRDAVVGPIGLRERHRLARISLINILAERTGDYHARWLRTGEFGAENLKAIWSLDALAAEMLRDTLPDAIGGHDTPQKRKLIEFTVRSRTNRKLLFTEAYPKRAEIITRRDAIIEEWKTATRGLGWATTDKIANYYEDKLGLPRNGWLSAELGGMDVMTVQSYIMAANNAVHLSIDDDPPSAGRKKSR